MGRCPWPITVPAPVDPPRHAVQPSSKTCQLPAPKPVELPAPARSDKPRLAHVLPWAFNVGGAQRMIAEWCAAEGERWKTVVFCPPRQSERDMKFALTGATLREVAHNDSVAAIRAFNPDVVVHHGPVFNFGRYVPPSGNVVWVVHGDYNFTQPLPTWSNPTAIFSNFQPTKNVDPSWPPVTEIRLGVDLERFRPRPLVAGIVGRLSPEKVPPEFVAALKEWNPGAWIVRFIGQGIGSPYHNQIRGELRGLPWIEFTGDVTPDDMPYEYRELDALISPSIRETGSYAIAEAMACGVPVVARAVGGVPFTTAGAAILCDTDAELLDSLELLESPATRSEAARAARTAAESYLDLPRHRDAHSAAYVAALKPSVSVLVPVYNTPRDWLLESWRSIQAQTFRAWEAVLVDDGSTHADTLAALGEIARDPRARVIRLAENSGISAALNTGIEACRCELIARMDGDDVMLPDRLERQVEYMGNHADCDVLGAQIEMFGPKIAPGRRTAHQTEVTLAGLRKTLWQLNHPAVMYRKAKIADLGGYDEKLFGAEDLDLWFRCLLGGLTVRNLECVLVRYRCSGLQNTASKLQLETVENLRRKYAS